MCLLSVAEIKYVGLYVYVGILKLNFLTAAHFRDTFCVIVLNFTIVRYDTRCYFNVRLKASLIYRPKPKA